jgi:hypothetical protein
MPDEQHGAEPGSIVKGCRERTISPRRPDFRGVRARCHAGRRIAGGKDFFRREFPELGGRLPGRFALGPRPGAILERQAGGGNPGGRAQQIDHRARRSLQSSTLRRMDGVTLKSSEKIRVEISTAFRSARLLEFRVMDTCLSATGREP